jgi:hypothetical protein
MSKICCPRALLRNLINSMQNFGAAIGKTIFEFPKRPSAVSMSVNIYGRNIFIILYYSANIYHMLVMRCDLNKNISKKTKKKRLDNHSLCEYTLIEEKHTSLRAYFFMGVENVY